MRRINNEHFASLVIGAACISINIHISSYGYGGYDLGFLYGAQNLLSDNNDIHDIPFVLPLLFAGLLKLSAWINGNTFFAPFAASSTVYAAALLTANLLYARASARDAGLRAVSLILFTCAISINLLNPGHLWHSDLTSMVAITLLWTTYCTKSFKSSAGQAIGCVLAAVILLCKQNLAPLYFASYLFYEIVSRRAQGSIPATRLFLRLALILALSGLVAFGIAIYVGINLRDYYDTLRLIGAERGSPFANAENYLKFAPPELLSLESLALSTRNLFVQADAKGFILDVAKLLWLVSFYVSCLFIPVAAIGTILQQDKGNLGNNNSRLNTLLRILFNGLGISGAIGLLGATSLPIFARLGSPALGVLILLSTYMLLTGIVCAIILVFSKYSKTSSVNARLGFDPSPLAMLSILFFGVSFVGLGTNWDLKSSDLSVSLMSLFIISEILAINSSGSKAYVARYFYTASIVALILSVTSSLTRARMTLVGPPAELNNRQCRLQTSYFWGTDFKSTKLHCTIDDEVNHQLGILKSVGATNVFFGPRMETYYSATSTKSPLRLPIWWHPGTSFSSRQADEFTVKFINNNFDAIILMRNDFKRMPEPIVAYIKSSHFSLIACLSVDIYVKAHFANRLPKGRFCMAESNVTSDSS